MGYGLQLKNNLYMGVDLNILLSGCKTDLKEYVFSLAEDILKGIEDQGFRIIQDMFRDSDFVTALNNEYNKMSHNAGKVLAAFKNDLVELSAKQRALFDFGVKFGYVWNNKILFGAKVGPTLSLYQVKYQVKNGSAHSNNTAMWGFTGGLFGAYKLNEKTSLSLNLDYRITKTPTKHQDDIHIKMKSFSVMAGWHYHF